VTSEDRDTVPADHDGVKGTESRSSSISSGKPARKHLPVWQESILLLAVALGLAIVLKALFIQAFYIPSPSMEPGLVENDRILVQKVSYWGGTPERGDVIVFEDPGNWLPADSTGPSNPAARVLAKVGLYPTGGHLVKRVIGVGGDTVTCCDEEGRLSVNGHPIDESQYVMPGAGCAAPLSIQSEDQPCTDKALKVTIPEGYLLVMGDNRANSEDSTARVCTTKETECPPTRGLVPVGNVVGKVFALVWPVKRFDHITRPDAFKDVPDAP
jgi:signal peptidase I